MKEAQQLKAREHVLSSSCPR